MHICVSKLTIIVSDNGLSPGRRQDSIWTNGGILLIGPFGTNFNFNRNSYIFVKENPIENVVRKMTAILSRPQCANVFPVGMAYICNATCVKESDKSHERDHEGRIKV